MAVYFLDNESEIKKPEVNRLWIALNPEEMVVGYMYMISVIKDDGITSRLE